MTMIADEGKMLVEAIFNLGSYSHHVSGVGSSVMQRKPAAATRHVVAISIETFKPVK